jgi:hypothetical protein
MTCWVPALRIGGLSLFRCNDDVTVHTSSTWVRCRNQMHVTLPNRAKGETKLMWARLGGNDWSSVGVESE